MWEYVQEALGKGTILNDEVAESEQRGVLFIRRASGISPFSRLRYIARQAFSPDEKDAENVFRLLMLSF